MNYLKAYTLLMLGEKVEPSHGEEAKEDYEKENHRKRYLCHSCEQ